ncbi:MAG: DUF4297 domain-containing protein [Opitutaceae bacterium]|nr:DUF4297 domain-containing protein [Opitutaceae bacterium]
MPAQETISPAEEAAQRSRRGYEYQDWIAVSFCLQMLQDKGPRKVACETQDDVVLTWASSAGSTVEEFVQVKSDRLKQQWSVSQICDQVSSPSAKDEKTTPKKRKDTSTFEKNALRDQGRRTARFRMVTRADVSELRLLTALPEQRKAADKTALAQKITEQLKGNTSLLPADIDYWVAEAYWEVRGDADSVENENYRLLSEVLENQEQRLLAAAELDRILRLLGDETRAMAMGRGQCGACPNSVTAEELRDWLSAKVRAIPHFLGKSELDALLQEERLSIGRCAGLWSVLGASEAEAQALARQQSIGSRADFYAELKPGFHWVTAGYGAGKSLSVERLFQAQVADYAAKRDRRIPIFLRARNLKTASVENAVLASLGKFHRDAGIPALFVVIDGIDEAGAIDAQRLLVEASEVSFGWPDSIVVATSTDLPISLDGSRREFPALRDDQAASIVSHFAQFEVAPWQVRDHLQDDCGLALFCALLGMALRETANMVPCRGELLNRVILAARKRSLSDANAWAAQFDTLCRVALHSTDTGGGPVQPSELGMTSIETSQLCSTKLIAEEGERLVFTVATMRLWFAAQALRKGLVSAEDLVSDLSRIRRWVDPLAIFIATTDFESASRYIEPLASTYPAVAAQVITAATRQFGKGRARSPQELEHFAKSIRRCLEAWLCGIAPLRKACHLTDHQGVLFKVRAGWDPPGTVILFFDDKDLPAASALSSDWRKSKALSYHLYHEPDEASHIWRATHHMVSDDLLKVARGQRWELADDILFHEEAWNQVVRLGRVYDWFATSVPWDVIDRSEAVLRQNRVWDWLCEKRKGNPLDFPAPHAPADIKDGSIQWIPACYSAAAALARARSTYGVAFAAYQRIVTKFFPNFAHDLRHSAWWPCKLVGAVSAVAPESRHPHWSIDYICEPVESEKDAVVEIELRDAPKWDRDQVQVRRAAVAKLRPNAPVCYWKHAELLNLSDSHPATALVRQWLVHDLEAAGWRDCIE